MNRWQQQSNAITPISLPANSVFLLYKLATKWTRVVLQRVPDFFFLWDYLPPSIFKVTIDDVIIPSLISFHEKWAFRMRFFLISER